MQIPPEHRLDPSDAKYVQCIETSLLGINTQHFACGHSNFVMYGGQQQPTCGILDQKCSHAEARKYFKLAMIPYYKLIGSTKRAVELVGWENTYSPFYEGAFVYSKTPVYAYTTERLGIYANRTHGTFFIDENTQRTNSPYLRTPTSVHG